MGQVRRQPHAIRIVGAWGFYLRGAMPYDNVSPELQDKMEQCVLSVEEQGKDKETAIRICYAAIVEGKTKDLLDLGLSMDTFEAVKMGARNNSGDKGRIKEIRQHAKTIHNLTNEMEPDEDETEPVAKAQGMTVYNLRSQIETGAIKAAGDYELMVLGIPFGGPKNGKDADGQYFSPNTKLFLDVIKTVPVFYYHGLQPDGKPQGDPVLIGTATLDHTDERGRWFKVMLNKGLDLARRVWEAAKQGTARASSGSINHLVRIASNGEILNWLLAELSLFDTDERRQPSNAFAVALPMASAKSHFELAGINPVIPDGDEPQAAEQGDEQPAAVTSPEGNQPIKSNTGVFTMDEKELDALIESKLKAKLDAEAKAAEAKAAEATHTAEAVKAAKSEWEAEAAKSGRLPISGMPAVAKYGDLRPYDNLDAGEQAVMLGVLAAAHKPASPAALKALAIKLEGDKGEVGRVGQNAMKAMGMKANEIDYSTLSNYGDEWVGVAYSQAIWESIRVECKVLARLPQFEFPVGAESIVLPLESTDPVWYNVAEATSSATGYAGPTPTVTASNMGTGKANMTLAKLGARVIWTGELDEGSIVPFAGQLRIQLGKSGAEYLESAILDGDPTLTVANINATDGAGGTAGKWYTVWAGMRYSALITTAANSRSAAGSLDVTDYLETVKLMGAGGRNALDVSKVFFVVDAATYNKTRSLPEVLTKDVSSSPTIEGGQLVKLWGYDLIASGAMLMNSAKHLTTAAGDISLTDSGNSYGQIVAVRGDQWNFGWRRRMTMETTRWAASDSTEIVAMVRCGLIQRDTEASAVTYYVGV